MLKDDDNIPIDAIKVKDNKLETVKNALLAVRADASKFVINAGWHYGR